MANDHAWPRGTWRPGGGGGAYDRCRGVLAENSGWPAFTRNRGADRADSCAPAQRGKQAIQPIPIMVSRPRSRLPLTPRPKQSAPATGRPLRLRVAPLRTIGAEHDDGLALGLAEEISAGLSRFRWISCVPGRSLARRAGWRRSIGGRVGRVGGGPGPGRHDSVRARPGSDHRPADRYAGGRGDRLGGPLRSSDHRSAEHAGRVGGRDRRAGRSRTDEARGPANRGGRLAARPDGAGSAAAGAARALSAGTRRASRCPPVAGGVAARRSRQFGRARLAGLLEPALCRSGLGGRSCRILRRGRPSGGAGGDARSRAMRGR